MADVWLLMATSYKTSSPLLPSGGHSEASHGDIRVSSGQDQLTW